MRVRWSRVRDLGRLAAAAGVLMVVAACADGGGGTGSADADGAGTPSAEASGSAGADAAVVTVHAGASGGTVLADADGMTLYTSDQEAGGTVACVDDCTQIWVPLTVDAATVDQPADVPGKLGTAERPDGDLQVTYDGVPVYTFSLDQEAGAVGGDGVSDAFGGTQFSWRAVTVDAGAAPSGGEQPAPQPTTQPPGGYDY